MTTARSAYERIDTAGEGAPWLTLVHGASQDRRVFSALLPELAPRFRVLRVDLAGHGASAAVPGPYGPVEYLDAVLGAMAAAGVDDTHYWGTHTGAAVGLLLAHRQPGRLRSLVLEGAVVPGMPIASVTRCFERARATTRERGLDAAREEWFERSPWFDVMRARPGECRAAEHRAMVRDFPGGPWIDDTTPQPVSLDDAALAGIDTETLLVNGEHEVADFVPVADRLESLLPRLRRVVVADAGGFPLWEFPGRVAGAVRGFLERA